MNREASDDRAWAEARFSDAREGALSPADDARFNELLENDVAIREAFAAFDDAVDCLQSYEPAAVPGEFVALVRSHVSVPAATPLPRKSTSKGMLIAAWATAAAAILLAGFAWLYRPAPERIRERVEVPVIREVVVERDVFRSPPVRVASGAVELVREGRVVRVGVGESLEIRAGDELRGLEPKRVEIGLDTAPLVSALGRWLDFARERLHLPTLRVDTAPLAKALDRATGSLANAAGKAAGALKDAAEASSVRSSVPPVAKTNVPKASSKAAPTDGKRGGEFPAGFVRRRLVIAPVELVREPNGVLFLEATGSDAEVIPELLALARDDRADVAALAVDTLREIQKRLWRQHGIGAPAAAAVVEKTSRPRGIARLFSRSEPPKPEMSDADRWQQWWAQYRDQIRRMVTDRAE